MRKVVLAFVFILILLTGCKTGGASIEIDNTVEENKIIYLDKKSKLEEENKFISSDELPCDIKISVNKIKEEEISYRAILDNPKVNMKNIKALLIHNNFSEDMFPSIGVFDDTPSLIVEDESLKGIELVGYIDTTKNVEELGLELRIWVEYVDDNNKKHEFYYKTDNISNKQDATKEEKTK